MISKYSAIVSSPICPLGISIFHEKLSGIDFLPPKTKLIKPTDAFSKEICDALENYFHDSQYPFSIPLHLQGTPFQQKVWKLLLTIPSGTTRSYGEIALQLKTSPRAVGNACRHNPIPIIVPCHRVIAQSHLGGYAGAVVGPLLQAKIGLLTHERYKHPTINCSTCHG